MNDTPLTVAIINRGEPAMRFIRAAQEVGLELGRTLRTVALFTEPDRTALFVREADDGVDLGEPTVETADGARISTYVHLPSLERALRACGADLAWVGWGFVAERPEFVELCDRLGVGFIGPSAEVMRKLGDKITAKRLAEDAGVPVAPWSGGLVPDAAAARAEADRLGYPVILKAAAGGGGRGIRLIRGPEMVEEAFRSATAEAEGAFGDGRVFIETCVSVARHVEVQVIGDTHGTVWAVGVRDCSVQRRNQKVIEESHSTALTEAQHDQVRAVAAQLCRNVGYAGAGTVEFLYDLERERFAFMEVNTRLQVEHPVTEATTGLDLVKLQVHVALGGRLEGEPPATWGHAVEARVCAEDPDAGFAPTPGEVSYLRLPAGPGVRVDCGVDEGDAVAPQFDSMIAKVIAHGRDRSEALARLRRALQETTIVLRGGTTNLGFLDALLARREVSEGELDIGWLDRTVTSGALVSSRGAEVAVLHAAIVSYDEAERLVEHRLLATAARGRPELDSRIGHQVSLSYRGADYTLEVLQTGPECFTVRGEGGTAVIRTQRHGSHEWRHHIGGRSHRVVSVSDGAALSVVVDGVPHRVSLEAGGVVRASAPAVVVAVRVAAGDLVEEGAPLLVVEAMKMETTVTAPLSGRVSEVFVLDNVQVGPGEPLLTIESADTEAPAAARSLSLFAAERTAVDRTSRGVLDDLQALIEGYDLPEVRARGLIEEIAALSPTDPAIWARTDELLVAHADQAALFERRAEGAADRMPMSPRECLGSYLRNPDRCGDGLPERFLDKLRKALAHHGVEDLTPGPELYRALTLIFRSDARAEARVGPVLATLEQRLAAGPALDWEAPAASREILDRVIAGARGRWEALRACAREVRFRYFEWPVLAEVRRSVYEQAVAHFDALASGERLEDRDARIRWLQECSQPLVGMIANRFTGAGPEERRLLMKILAERIYVERPLMEPSVELHGDTPVYTAQYERLGERLQLLVCHTWLENLRGMLAHLRSKLEDVPEGHAALVDIHCIQRGALGERFDADSFLRVLDEDALPPPCRRVVLIASGLSSDPTVRDVRRYCFRRGPDGQFAEDRLYRDLHPLVAKRLELWRLRNFALVRLPSPEDVYLFEATAHANSKDRRLFAVAEVRDLTPIRDAAGRVVSLPQLERTYQECLAGIRRAQWRAPARARWFWNRITLHIRPPVELSPAAQVRLIARLSPAARGLGLQKVVVRMAQRDETGALRHVVLHISWPGGTRPVVRTEAPADTPVHALTPFEQRVHRLNRRGLSHPADIVRTLTPDVPTHGVPAGRFTELELVDGALVPIEREPGANPAHVVIGRIVNTTDRYPEGMQRILILSDPSSGMGNVAEPECSRITAALDLAEAEGIPAEWFAVSAGARISMDSGVENMDWIARVLRRLVTFTQAGGEVNIVVMGVNVGAQPYWNAEATMLMHTRGVLIMIPQASMVLTGKRALDYSGGVSAEDDRGIGGYDHVMGPNGQAQYFAESLGDACAVLMRHYEHSYVHPGERFPRKAPTTDPADRDFRATPHGRVGVADFAHVGDVFSAEHNAARKRPFDIRRVMRAVADSDHEPLERWPDMRDAEVAVVWDAHLGGHPLRLIGIESRPLPRYGLVPPDGPEQWTSGTLFPAASKKVARGINSASGSQPLVVLANLSGFDGSPESMRNRQLEFGAEIGRAIVNFDGPIVFCVVSRYHGGAFVVFSQALNDHMVVAALDGAFASVIGGAPAAGVVFAREVSLRTREDARVEDARKAARAATAANVTTLRARLSEVERTVRAEKLGELATEFDQIHSIERARDVGAVHQILPPESLRPFLIRAIEEGMERVLQSMRA